MDVSSKKHGADTTLCQLPGDGPVERAQPNMDLLTRSSAQDNGRGTSFARTGGIAMAPRNRVVEIAEPFSAATLALLGQSGWTADYRGPVDLYLECYRREALECPQAAIRFLARFGGLVVPYRTDTHQDDVLDLRADRAALGSGHGALASYEAMGTRGALCPIGSYQHGDCLLLMDGQGAVLGGTEWSLLYVGRTGEEAIERILSGAAMETVASDRAEVAPQSRNGHRSRMG